MKIWLHQKRVCYIYNTRKVIDNIFEEQKELMKKDLKILFAWKFCADTFSFVVFVFEERCMN